MESDKTFVATTSKYKILHHVKIPTKMSDYDYDEYDNRYITSFLHTLEFYDNILGNEIFRFSFPTDVCAEMVSILLKLFMGAPIHGKEASIIIPPSSIEGIYSNVIFSRGYQNSLSMRVTNSHSSFLDSPRFIFVGEEEISTLVNLLEIDEIVDMFVVPSSDRW